MLVSRPTWTVICAWDTFDHWLRVRRLAPVAFFVGLAALPCFVVIAVLDITIRSLWMRLVLRPED